MQALSESLQPYKDSLAQVATVVTIAQFFSGILVCNDIYKKGSTKGIPATPFIGGTVIGILMLQLGLILNDAAMLIVNVAAIFLNVCYTVFYYYYSDDKNNEVLKPLGIGTAVVAVFLGYASVESPENLEFRYGLVVTLLLLLLMGSPLLGVQEILEKKDASSIPFPLTLMGALVSILWFFYGIIIMNMFMVIQNLIGFFLCVTQLALIFMYPGPEGSKKKKFVKRD